MKHKFSSVSNDTSAKRSHRGVGQAVAALVMALALTIGGAGTTILLASQPAGLTVAPVTVDWEENSSLKHNNTKSTRPSPLRPVQQRNRLRQRTKLPSKNSPPLPSLPLPPA